MLKLIDTHAHLDQVEGLTQVLNEAREAGVVGVVAVGIDHKANQKNLEIKKATQSPKIFLAFGVHPESLEDRQPKGCKEDIEFIEANVAQLVAVGEIGLDYWYQWAKKDEVKKKAQQEIFARQLDLAKEFNLPVVIHSRGAWRECLNMTKGTGVKKAVFHWYSGPIDVLDEILDCGYFISASPALAYSPQHQQAVAHAPVSQILIETDSPVFYGSGSEGFRATPKDVIRTLQLYARLKHIEEEKTSEIFYGNAQNFFGIQ